MPSSSGPKRGGAAAVAMVDKYTKQQIAPGQVGGAYQSAGGRMKVTKSPLPPVVWPRPAPPAETLQQAHVYAAPQGMMDCVLHTDTLSIEKLVARLDSRGVHITSDIRMAKTSIVCLLMPSYDAAITLRDELQAERDLPTVRARAAPAAHPRRSPPPLAHSSCSWPARRAQSGAVR